MVSNRGEKKKSAERTGKARVDPLKLILLPKARINSALCAFNSVNECFKSFHPIDVHLFKRLPVSASVNRNRIEHTPLSFLSSHESFSMPIYQRQRSFPCASCEHPRAFLAKRFQTRGLSFSYQRKALTLNLGHLSSRLPSPKRSRIFQRLLSRTRA